MTGHPASTQSSITRSRRDLLATGAGVVTAGLAGLAGCSDLNGSDVIFEETFETGDLEGWDRDAAIGPEVDIEDFEWAIDVTDERASTGDYSCRVFTEGRYDDGTAWIVREGDLPEADRYEVTLDAWSESESFNLLRYLVGYLGPERPEAEEDFPEPGANSTGLSGTAFGGLREPLHRAEGWEPYRFVWEPDAAPGTAHLAFGVSVVWESDAVHYLDDITVRALE